MANQFYNENSKAIDITSKYESDKYAAGHSTVGHENNNRDAINYDRKDYYGKEGMEAAIVDERIEGTISSMNQAVDWAHSDKFAKGYRTDFGAFMNFKTDIAMKDLGQLMTDRMQKSMSKENINDYGYVGLAYTSRSTNNDLKKSGEYETKSDPSDLYVTKDSTTDARDDIYDSDLGNYNGGNKKPLIYDDITSVALSNSRSYGIRIGQAKVLNPDFQFNELDDVRSDIREYNIGRLYGERIYDYNLPILFITPGTVKVNTKLISDLNSFKGRDTIGKYLKDGGQIPARIFNAAFNIVNGFKTGVDWVLSKGMWYDFDLNFKQYSNYINEMLIELALWMGLYDEDSTLTHIAQDKVNSAIKKFSAEASKNNAEAYFNSLNAKTTSASSNEYLMDDGTSVWGGYAGGCENGNLNINYILPTLYSKVTIEAPKNPPTDISGTDEKKWDLDLTRMIIPFALSKSISVSETFSNSVDTHPVSTELNGMYESTNDIKLKGQWGTLRNATEAASGKNLLGLIADKDTDGLMKAVTSGVEDFIKSSFGSVATVFGASGALANADAGMIIKGEGRFQLPKIWNDSSYSRNYSINMKFRSPYGDRISIFENTFIPLLFLIGLTSPRQAGFSAYTSPFYIKAFSKGLISCEMGMITSLSINRGEDRNDRTIEGFFRTISVNLTIEDVMPTMSMSMSSGIFAALKSTNTGLKNYLTGLANIDFIEREALSHGLNSITKKMSSVTKGFGTSVRAAFLNNTPGGKRLAYIASKVGAVKNDYEVANMFHSSY